MSRLLVKYAAPKNGEAVVTHALKCAVAAILKSNSRTCLFGYVVPVIQRGKQLPELFAVEIGGADIDLHLRVGRPSPKANSRGATSNYALPGVLRLASLVPPMISRDRTIKKTVFFNLGLVGH